MALTFLEVVGYLAFLAGSHAQSPSLSLREALLLSFGSETADGGGYLSELAGLGREGR